MSKETDEFEKRVQSELEKSIDFDRRKKELSEKDLLIRENRTNNTFETLVRNQREIKEAAHVDFSRLSDEAIEQMVADNEAYLIAAKNPLPFVNKDFENIVPFFRNNLILVGSSTGGGKSTMVSNIVYTLLRTKNSVTGKPHRILLLTNEENPSDFYNRTTCLLKGEAYTNHKNFTDDQRKEFGKYIRMLGKSGKLTVIGDRYQGVSGWTTTPEGIALIFDNLIKNNDIYSTVILDYYQNVNTSKVDPLMAPWQVQEKFANEMDRIKLAYPAPIVVMSQMDKLKDEEDTTPFKLRINGRKNISDKATFIFEIVSEPKLLKSRIIVWKSRYTSACDREFNQGYDRGRLVNYSIEFQKNVSKMVDRNLERQMAAALGMTTDGDKIEEDKIEDDKKEEE